MQHTILCIYVLFVGDGVQFLVTAYDSRTIMAGKELWRTQKS
jgi:hypothetical protein